MEKNFALSSLNDLRLDVLAELCLPIADERDKLEASFTDFVAAAWKWIDSSDYIPHWSIEALCKHLEAVSRGDIRRLLINVPPRFGKTNLVSICWMAWVWAQTKQSFVSGAGVRFLTGSYNSQLSLTNANMARRLILSPWYQERWGSRFHLREDQNLKSQFATTAGGGRFSTSVGGSLLGMGYDIGILDDPHNLQGVESDAERQTTSNWLREIKSTRQNDPKKSALVCVMQRLHTRDMSGEILDSEDAHEWVHLMLPMRHDPVRHCVTTLKRDENGMSIEAWQDPRKGDGDLLWPERFGEKEVAIAERELGPYMASGRLQQQPRPQGGGIIKGEWWKLWENETYPELTYILASLDTAYTQKQENDPSALTVWGVFHEKPTGAPKAILLYAWEGREMFHELVTIVTGICNKAASKGIHPSFPVDKLLIEAKSAGLSVVQEMSRLYGNSAAFTIEQFDPDKFGDKVARANAVVPLFSSGCVYAPDRKFADMVRQQVEDFPKGAHDDLVDSTTMALRYLRLTGMLEQPEEFVMRQTNAATYRPRQALPYG